MGRNLVAITLLASCDGVEGADTHSLAETGTSPTDDSDTVTDPTSPTDTDPSTTPPDPDETAVRVVHAAAELGPQDLVVNDNLPPVLQALLYTESTPYSPRPPGVYTFAFKSAGAPLAEAWTTFDFDLVDARRHTLVIFGTGGAPATLRLLDDDATIPAEKARLRWSHVAPALPASIDLYDVERKAPILLGLAYGVSIELDQDPLSTEVGIDVDADAVPDLVFASFTRPAGDYFHVMITNETDGTPYLLGQTTAGATPRRDLVP